MWWKQFEIVDFKDLQEHGTLHTYPQIAMGILVVAH